MFDYVFFFKYFVERETGVYILCELPDTSDSRALDDAFCAKSTFYQDIHQLEDILEEDQKCLLKISKNYIPLHQVLYQTDQSHSKHLYSVELQQLPENSVQYSKGRMYTDPVMVFANTKYNQDQLSLNNPQWVYHNNSFEGVPFYYQFIKNNINQTEKSRNKYQAAHDYRNFENYPFRIHLNQNFYLFPFSNLKKPIFYINKDNFLRFFQVFPLQRNKQIKPKQEIVDTIWTLWVLYPVKKMIKSRNQKTKSLQKKILPGTGQSQNVKSTN